MLVPCRTRVLTSAAVALALGGCAGQNHVDAISLAARTGGSRHVITASEALESRAPSVLALVAQVRPEFLRTRGSAHPVRVVIDHLPYGTASDLASVPANTVKEVRYLGAREATQRFGTGYSAGAILVMTRTGPLGR